MAAMTRQRPQPESTTAPAKVEDNTLDEQQSAASGQSHVGSAPQGDRERRIAVAAYLRAERRGFVPGAELEDWLEAENDVDSRS